MKAIERSEMWIAMSPPASILLLFAVVYLDPKHKNPDIAKQLLFLLIYLIPATSMTVCFFFDRMKRSNLALICLILIGGCFALFFCLLFFSGAALYYHHELGLVFLAPILSSVIMIGSAIRRRYKLSLEDGCR